MQSPRHSSYKVSTKKVDSEEFNNIYVFVWPNERLKQPC